MTAMGRMLLTTLILLLAACGGERRLADSEAAIHTTFANGGEAVAGVDEVSAALLPPMQLNVPGVDSEQLEPRFDVSVRRVQAGEFFMGLVSGTRYNMLVHPKVGGRITLAQKNVSVPEVMAMVRSVYGYPFKRSGDSFQVFPNAMHTRLFKVDYLSVVRSGSSYTHSAPGRVTRGSASKASGGDAKDEEQKGDESSKAENGSAVTTRHDSDFWSEMRAALEIIVGTGNGRRLAVNAQTGMVMVHAMPDELRAVEEYLAASQASANRQVILEARILEVELKDGFQSGINWASIQQSGGTTYSGGMLNGGTIFDGSGVGGSAGDLVGLLTPGPGIAAGTGMVTDAFGGVFGLSIQSSDFSGFIELLSSQGDVHVLSSPRVSTVNNQKAVIKVGADEFFVTGMTTTYQDVNGQQQPNVTLELSDFFSGVSLDVTPQISEDDNIVLHVHPAVSDVNEQVKVIGTSVGTITMPLAANSVRESDTVVRARNGQLVVIGGLMQNSSRDEDAGVPGLSGLPLVGGLFKHNRESKRKSELVILLKPIVVDSSGEQWNEHLRDSSLGVRALGRP